MVLTPARYCSLQSQSITLDWSLLLRTLADIQAVANTERATLEIHGYQIKVGIALKGDSHTAHLPQRSALIVPLACDLPGCARKCAPPKQFDLYWHPADQLRYHWFRQERSSGCSTCQL
ncbi:unnamed protein product [Polarella glacialis]|uniref:Uncharacterized protein n=1 Tax=Polarella glacialis TaxID=89957 RepID=A0A813KT46_POLGL|nr:unnamed protein product [Polarella glacialis]